MANNTERLYRIEALIRARGSVSFQALLDELEVSRATLKRDLEYLRSRMGAPIEYDRDANGYRFALESAGGVAAALASNQLWQHAWSLEEPLQVLEQWDSETLQRQCLPWLAAERACVLEAVPA